jgi:hypothetical protein
LRREQDEEERRIALERQPQEEARKSLEEQRLLEQEDQDLERRRQDEEKRRQEALQVESDYNRSLYEAQRALIERKLDTAISGFQEALALVPDSAEAAASLERARHIKEICQAVTGRWKWFNGGRVTFYTDGTLLGEHHILPGNRGVWECTDPDRRRFTVRWQQEESVDELRLSSDGKSIRGTNQRGVRISGQRMD